MRLSTDKMIENFKKLFPHTAEHVDVYTQIEWGQLHVKMESGDEMIYDSLTKTCRALPKDHYYMTREECITEFRKRLQTIMKYQGMTQNKLSVKTGISQPTINGYLAGKSLPDFYNADKIAKALNCSMDDFRYVKN